MQRAKVSIPWEAGLHLRPAAAIVKLARHYRSRITLRAGRKIADAGNILTIMLLAATFGTAIDVEISGPDEDEAVVAVLSVFDNQDLGGQEVVDFTELDRN